MDSNSYGSPCMYKSLFKKYSLLRLLYVPHAFQMRTRPNYKILFLLMTTTLLSASLLRADFTPSPNPLPFTVVLLTSLHLDPDHENYEIDLQNEFRAHFVRLGYRIKVKHGASQNDLYRELRVSENIAVFWLSHAGMRLAAQPGLDHSGIIVDQKLRDVSTVFQAVHPDMKYLAVIGCHSNEALDAVLRNHRVFEQNPTLHVESFNATIEGLEGLRQSMNRSNAILNPHAIRGFVPHRCERLGHAITVEVTRHLPAGVPGTADYLYPAVRIELRNRLVTVLSPAFRGMITTQRFEIEVPEELIAANGDLRAAELKLVASTGSLNPSSAERFLMGSLAFRLVSSSETTPQWTVFADHQGRPLGAGSLVYRYVAAPIQAQSAHPYQPIACPTHDGWFIDQ